MNLLAGRHPDRPGDDSGWETWASLAFYRDLLGLEVSREEGNTLTLRDLLVLEENPGIARRPVRARSPPDCITSRSWCPTAGRSAGPCLACARRATRFAVCPTMR